MAARTPADGKRGSQPAGVGIQLPQAPTPFGAYVEGVQSGDLLFLSGNAPCRKPEAKIRWAHRRGTGRRGRPGSGTRRGSECLAVARLKLVVASGAFSKPWRPGWRMHFPARRRRASWPMVLSLQVPPEFSSVSLRGCEWSAKRHRHGSHRKPPLTLFSTASLGRQSMDAPPLLACRYLD
jgi:hypothetical protein